LVGGLLIASLAGGLLAEPPASNDAAEGVAVDSDVNPYLAREGAPTEMLVEFVFRMREKPVSIRRRDGFAAAVIDAADRILAAKPEDYMRSAALVCKLETLHETAVWGDDAADQQLIALTREHLGSPLAKVAKAAAFYDLERQALDAESLTPEESSELLEKLNAFFAENRLGKPHLRMASATVAIINRLPDDETALTAYKAVGDLWAKSSDLELKRYGQKIAKGPKGGQPVEWAGKTMDLAGLTVAGDEFDWDAYRGKVVLVDFWATWCGPCRAALPGLLEVYAEYREQGFEVVGVSVDRDADALAEFVEQQQIPWPNIADVSGEMANSEKYQIRAIPATFLVGADGKIIATGLHGAALRAKLTALLKPAKDDEK
jgi:thiol-disulfide isomerase/thioredoxin